MKKICHITVTPQNHLPRLIKECISIQKINYIPYIVSDGKSFVKDNINFIGVSTDTFGRLYRMIKISKDIYNKALEIDADIYQIHDPELLRYALKLKKLGKKVVFDSHEFYGFQIQEKKYIPKIIRKIIASLYMKYESYVCTRIDGVIQVCKLSGKDYFDKRAKRSIFIANYSVIGDFEPTNKIPFEKRSAVAYIGDLNHDRGITHLIKAVAKTKVKLILCGKFIPESYHDELKNMPEYACVDYRGFLSYKEIVEILDKCLAGISTLLHIGQYPKIDTLPTKCYEYMAMEMPIIISDSIFAKKLLEENKNGICVKPDNIEEIAEAITYLINNCNKAKEMGKKGRKAFEEKYNWQVEEKKLIEFYESLT